MCEVSLGICPPDPINLIGLSVVFDLALFHLTYKYGMAGLCHIITENVGIILQRD